MHRALVSTARLLGAAASRHGAPAAFRGTALRPAPRSLAAAAARRYHNISAIATPFPGLQPAVPDTAAPARRWGAAAPSLGNRLASLWQLYLTSLARRPLLTKACTSFACVIIGDSIAQAIGGKMHAAAAMHGALPLPPLNALPPTVCPVTHPSAPAQARPTASSACCGWRRTAARWAPPAGTTGTAGWRRPSTQRRRSATPRCAVLFHIASTGFEFESCSGCCSEGVGAPNSRPSFQGPTGLLSLAVMRCARKLACLPLLRSGLCCMLPAGGEEDGARPAGAQ